MRSRLFKLLCLVVGLAVSAVYYGHYYTSVVSAGSNTHALSGPHTLLNGLDGVLYPHHQTEEERRGNKKGETTFSKVMTNAKTQAASSCPTPLRLRVQNDTYFGKLFNFDIPVLMWNSHMTEDTRKTLSQRPVPYGWKDLPPEDVASTLQLLNDSANQGLFDWQPPKGCIRCAVVGNGGILNGSRKGTEIDQHDYVFRLNGAVIKGFEEDVGTKTSFYGFTVNTMKNSLINYNEYGFTRTPQGQGIRYIFIPSDLRDYVMLRSSILGVTVPSGFDKGDRPSQYFGPESKPRKFKLLHPDFLLYTRDRFLKSDILETEYANMYMPSTGGLMLLTALHSCDQVDAYGFITTNFKEFSDHYYDKQKKPLEFYVNHDMMMEMHFWRNLHDQGIMNLYQR